MCICPWSCLKSVRSYRTQAFRALKNSPERGCSEWKLKTRKMWVLLFTFVAFCWRGAIAAVDLTGCQPNPPQVIDTLFKMKGDIYSPGYSDGKYPNNLKCGYTIKAPFGFRIKLTFIDFDIDAHDLCMKDVVAIHEGMDNQSPLHGSFCGNETINPLISDFNALHIAFYSDFLAGKRGFHIQYETALTHAMCPAGKSICRNGNCYTIAEKCNGIDECGDGTDEENCGRQAVATECGKPAIKPKSSDVGRDRIVGGQEATPGSWPWQADLQGRHYHPNGHLCGGTLISPQWLVTAAHCVQGYWHPMDWRIHFGNHHKFKKDPHEQIRYPQRIIVYPGYTGSELSGQLDTENDIALMKLNAPVKITDHVSTACMPTQGQEVAAGTVCTATGWGMTRGSGNNSVLKQVPLSIRRATECMNDMIQFNNKTMICVANDEGYQDVCHGDSGGPLVCNIAGKYNVMGATSFGTATNFESGLCSLPEARSVFAKVSDKTDWITKMVNQYS